MYSSSKVIRRSRFCDRWRAIRRSFREPCRSRWQRLCSEPGAPRRQYHGLHQFRAFDGRQVAPDAQAARAGVDHAAILLHPQTPAHLAFWHEADAAAPKLGIRLVAAGVHDAGEVERAIAAVAAQPNGGRNVYPHTVTRFCFDALVELAASTGCRRCIRFAITPKRADCCRMEWKTSSIWCLARPIMSIALCVAPIPVNCRSKRQPNSNL